MLPHKDYSISYCPDQATPLFASDPRTNTRYVFDERSGRTGSKWAFDPPNSLPSQASYLTTVLACITCPLEGARLSGCTDGSAIEQSLWVLHEDVCIIQTSSQTEMTLRESLRPFVPSADSAFKPSPWCIHAHTVV